MLAQLVATYSDLATRKSLSLSCTQLRVLVLQQTTALTVRWPTTITWKPVPFCRHTREELHTPACFPFPSECTLNFTGSVLNLFMSGAQHALGWRQLQRLELWNAGTTLKPIAKALLHIPLPKPTHLLLHTDNMPLSNEAKQMSGHALQAAAPTSGKEAKFLCGRVMEKASRALSFPWTHQDIAQAHARDEKRRGRMPLQPATARCLGEAWGKGHLPKLHTLRLNDAKVKGEVVAALFQGAGWAKEEEAIEEVKKTEGGGAATTQGAPNLAVLDLRGTYMGKQGPQALAQAFQQPTTVPLESLFLGGWRGDRAAHDSRIIKAHSSGGRICFSACWTRSPLGS